MAGGAGDRAGQPEVGDLDPAVVGEQDVLGLDVAVDQPGLVRGAERGEHRLEHLEGLPRAQVAAGRGSGRAGCGRAPAPSRGTRGPGRRPGRRRRPRWGATAGPPTCASRMNRETNSSSSASARVHHLEGDGAVEPVVVGLVDGGHPAARQTWTDVVAPVEHLPDQGVADSRVHGASLRVARAVARPRTRRRAAHSNRALRAITLATYRLVSGYIPFSRTERRPW